MNEPFKNHFSSHTAQWHQLAKDKVVSEDDLIKAMNASNKYTYKEQNDALKRVNKAVLEYSKKDDRPGVLNFAQGLVDATDDMIRDKVISSFRDINKVTEDDIRLKANKIGIPFREFKEQFDLVKKRIDTEEGRKRRAKEIEDMKWYNPAKWATSDYEKQRYIDDPNTSLIGKEGKFNPYSKEGQMAISDAAFGVAGAVGDALPGWGSVAGPLVRGARDAYHWHEGSKYQKDFNTAVTDFAGDAAFNILTEKTPTTILRQTDRTLKQASRADKFFANVDNYRIAKQDGEATRQALKELKWQDGLETLSDEELGRKIKELPDGTLKKLLVGYAPEGQVPNREKIGEMVSLFEGMEDAYKSKGIKHDSYFTKNGDIRKDIRDYSEFVGGPEVPAYLERQARADAATKNVKRAAIVADAWQKGGGGAVKEANTFRGRGSKPETSDREDIDWFKTNYARDWEAGFVPRGKEDEPIMKAYEEWKAENRAQKPSLKDIMGGI